MAKLVKHTVKQSRQVFEVLSQSADTQLKQKFMEQIELAEQLVNRACRRQRSITLPKIWCLRLAALTNSRPDSTSWIM